MTFENLKFKLKSFKISYNGLEPEQIYSSLSSRSESRDSRALPVRGLKYSQLVEIFNVKLV